MGLRDRAIKIRVFKLSNRKTTRLISMTFDWLRIFCSQSDNRDINLVMTQFLKQNVPIAKSHA